jgi:hypothetical protein
MTEHVSMAAFTFTAGIIGRKIQSLNKAYIKNQVKEIDPVDVTVRELIALPPAE